MFHVSRRWRLFLLVPVLLLEAMAQAPTTTIRDTVYQADGSPAQGTLLISWPEFTTVGGVAVAPGTTSATLGAGGSLSVALVPSQGATPVNTVYTVVYQLSEARWSDSGWGPDNDRNLIGRFTTQTFTIPRLSQVQNCYLQQYDGSNPPRYSRYTTALHVDYPL